MSEMFQPQTVPDALVHLQQYGSANSRMTILAGGTDIYPAHVGRQLSGPLMDISAIDALRDITTQPVSELPAHTPAGAKNFLRLGALTTWTDIWRRRHRALHSPALDALVMAAGEVGGVQIQNRGTVAGNLCNASPAADGVPALQALNALVEVASAGTTRVLRIDEFVLGPRAVALQPAEMVTAVLLPINALAASHSIFLKLGHRRYLVISAVMAALRLDWRDDTVCAASVSVGSCGPTAVRLDALSSQLTGLNSAAVKTMASAGIAAQWLEPLSPIDDMRGSAQYRRDAANTLICRALSALAQTPGESVGPANDKQVRA